MKKSLIVLCFVSFVFSADKLILNDTNIIIDTFTIAVPGQPHIFISETTYVTITKIYQISATIVACSLISNNTYSTTTQFAYRWSVYCYSKDHDRNDYRLLNTTGVGYSKYVYGDFYSMAIPINDSCLCYTGGTLGFGYNKINIAKNKVIIDTTNLNMCWGCYKCTSPNYCGIYFMGQPDHKFMKAQIITIPYTVSDSKIENNVTKSELYNGLAFIFDISGRFVDKAEVIDGLVNWSTKRNGVYVARFQDGRVLKFVRLK